MARPLTPSNLLAALQAWEIPYVETSGWKTRQNGGGWGDVEGFLWHHTGDDAPDGNDLSIVTNGRAGLPGPLCQFGLADDGKVFLVAAGAANHAGGGDAAVLRAMIARKALPASRYTHAQLGDYPDAIIGNPRLAGVESFYYASNNPAQRKMMTRLAACWIWAMNKQNGTTWGAERAIGHREWQRGKVDPRVFGTDSLDKMRAEVAAYLKAGPTGEDDVSAADVANYPLGKNPADQKTPVTLGYSLEIARNYSYRAYTELVAMRAQVTALVGAVAALSKGEPLDEQKLLESIQAATRQGILDAGAALNAAQEVAK